MIFLCCFTRWLLSKLICIMLTAIDMVAVERHSGDRIQWTASPWSLCAWLRYFPAEILSFHDIALKPWSLLTILRFEWIILDFWSRSDRLWHGQGAAATQTIVGSCEEMVIRSVLAYRQLTEQNDGNLNGRRRVHRKYGIVYPTMDRDVYVIVAGCFLLSILQKSEKELRLARLVDRIR